MRKRYALTLLCCAWMTACTGSEAPSRSSMPSVAAWSKVGESEFYTYYADHSSIRKADETVTMSDLFDYKTAQAEGGISALSKTTAREYDCQNQESQPVKTTWHTGQMGAGTVARTSGVTGQLTTVMAGTATAALMQIACGS